MADRVSAAPLKLESAGKSTCSLGPSLHLAQSLLFGESSGVWEVGGEGVGEKAGGWPRAQHQPSLDLASPAN